MDRIPTWVIDDRSGAAEGDPAPWEAEAGEHGTLWSRGGLQAFGRANALYRNKHYRCPECESFLRPLRRRGFFACVGCLVAFQWRAGSLRGHGRDSDAVVRVDPAEFNFR